MLPEEEKHRLLGVLERQLNAGIIGQERAAASVASIVCRAELGLTEPGKPLASFLFLGPTGVGKTQMAKDVNAYTGGGEDSIIVLDMSEFHGPAATRQLLGTPRVNGRLHSILKSSVRMVVFDEIEKAHRPVLDLLLQILGEARVTLGDGQKLDFRSRYVALTSNIASEGILKAQSGSSSSRDRFVRNQALQYLRPELFGRIDLVEVFQPLNFAQRVEIGRAIAAKEVARLRALGEPAENMLGDTLLAMCAKDCDLGVRPLKRKIHAIIQEALVQKKLGGAAA